MTSDAIRDFPVTEIKLTLYGKDPLLRLCTVVAMALFLKGRSMRAWCSFYDADKPERVKSALVVSDKACGRQKIAPFITVKREQH